MFFVPIWTKVDTATLHTYTMYAWRFQETNPIDNLGHTDFIPYIFIRMAQLKLGALNGLLMTGIIGLVVYLAMKNETKLLAGVAGQYKLGFILPAIAIVSNLIANRLIKRDEKLVRSVDKIR